jgi:hypothetical protein
MESCSVEVESRGNGVIGIWWMIPVHRRTCFADWVSFLPFAPMGSRYIRCIPLRIGAAALVKGGSAAMLLLLGALKKSRSIRG